jgi:hypothetical protein
MIETEPIKVSMQSSGVDNKGVCCDVFWLLWIYCLRRTDNTFR